jgi:hypothetical protein
MATIPDITQNNWSVHLSFSRDPVQKSTTQK